MQDAYGNYQAGLEPGPSIPGSRGTLRYGSGAPSSTIGNPGDTYVDISNGNFYKKSSGGWVIQAGSGTVIEAVEHGSGPPTTPPTDPSVGAVYYDDDAASPSYGIFWGWDVSASAWIGA